MVRCYVLLIAMLICAAPAAAQKAVRNDHFGDSTAKALPERLAGCDTIHSSPRNDRLYDTIRARYTRRAVPRLLYNTIFTRPCSDPFAENKVVDENKRYEPYAGKVISRIEIYPLDLIGGDSLWIERAANSLHYTTRERTIRSELLFRPGQKLDPEVITRTNRNIRSRSYISDVETLVRLDEDDPGKVVVTVITRDSWSISGDASLNFNGRSMIELYDANILGFGSKLSVQQNFTWRDWAYGGLMVGLDVPNILGSYFDSRLRIGRSFENSTIDVGIDKEFMLRTDYSAGASWNRNNTLTYMLYADSSQMVGSQTLDLWAGKSFYLPRLGSSIYAILRFTDKHFGNRPEVAPRLNPSFHADNLTMLGAGFYRERFYTANLIYGYGYREYLAAGYRVETVAGHLNGEFDSQWYLGASYRIGGFNRLGYLMGGIAVGNYISADDGCWNRGALHLEALYFTNLWTVGERTRIRQFVTLGYLQGWNRYLGADERVCFEGWNRLRALDMYTSGVNRARLALETVIFTPFQPLGFRMAIFAYSDMGLLGDDPNIFRNPFYSTIGVGIRMKNERLVFSALELRIGFAVGHGGLLNSQYISLSSQSRIEQVRFTPQPPQPVAFK